MRRTPAVGPLRLPPANDDDHVPPRSMTAAMVALSNNMSEQGNRRSGRASTRAS